MIDMVSVDRSFAALLPARLTRLQRVTGVPVVFGGAVDDGQRLRIDRVVGTLGSSLKGLGVQAGHGLGGAVLRDRIPHRVNEYASTPSITHDYDRIVVHEERLTSVFAVPVCVGGRVRGVLYGAARDHLPLGDRPLRGALTVARQLERDLDRELPGRPPLDEAGGATRIDKAIGALEALLGSCDDPDVHRRVIDAMGHLRAAESDRVATSSTTTGPCPSLTPRELQVLRLSATGASNLEIAAELGLGRETVKAYLRAAMRKLDVGNRTAAVYAARQVGLL